MAKCNQLTSLSIKGLSGRLIANLAHDHGDC